MSDSLRARLMAIVAAREPGRPYVRRLPARGTWAVCLQTTPWTWVVLHENTDRVAALDFAHQWVGFRAALDPERATGVTR